MKMKQSFNFKSCRMPVHRLVFSEEGVVKTEVGLRKKENGYGSDGSVFGITGDGLGRYFAEPCSFEVIF